MADQEKALRGIGQKADFEIRKSETLFKRAKEQIGKEYHDYLITLPANLKIWFVTVDLNAALKKKGCYTTDKRKGVFIKIDYPYFGADGKVKMVTDEHRKTKKALYIKTAVNPTDNSKEINLGHEVTVPPYGVVAVVESEIRGIAYGTSSLPKPSDSEGQHQKFSSTMGKDYEAGETAAISRALGFLGYGIFGNAFQEDEERKKSHKDYDEALTKMKAIQKTKEVSDVQMKKLAQELGIQGKTATLEDILMMVTALEEYKAPKKEEEKNVDGEAKSEGSS